MELWQLDATDLAHQIRTTRRSPLPMLPTRRRRGATH
jgi:hypothetical protein